MTTENGVSKALLVLPRLRIQNANAISSPLTWGFPAITAFTGLMTALKRRLVSHHELCDVDNGGWNITKSRCQSRKEPNCRPSQAKARMQRPKSSMP